MNGDGDFPYWVTKALILLSDNYVELKDNFQAKATLKGVIGDSDIPELIQQELDVTLFEPEVVFTEHRGHGTELAKAFVDKGFQIVVAVGGDGTVNEVGQSLIHTNSALGIVPIGSGNVAGGHLEPLRSLPEVPWDGIKRLF